MRADATGFCGHDEHKSFQLNDILFKHNRKVDIQVNVDLLK